MNHGEGIFAKIDTVIVRVRQLEEARAWYEEKLGFHAMYTDESQRLVVFDVGEKTSLTIYELGPGEVMASRGASRCYPIFYASDIQAAHQLLLEREVEVGPIEGEPGATQWFVFKDCDGNALEACHYQ